MGFGATTPMWRAHELHRFRRGSRGHVSKATSQNKSRTPGQGDGRESSKSRVHPNGEGRHHDQGSKVVEEITKDKIQGEEEHHGVDSHLAV